jgi:hypothetical protein
MHVLHALPHDVTGRCRQLLHGLFCFDIVSDIPLSPATCGFKITFDEKLMELLFNVTSNTLKQKFKD